MIADNEHTPGESGGDQAVPDPEEFRAAARSHAADPHDTVPPSMEAATPDAIVAAPTSFGGILRRLGPGLIIAGSIVGSGELIATTKTGAVAGISLLWLIVVGCLIKVFVQIELGRFTISHGETTLAALDQVPGPRMRVNWLVWFWMLTVLASIGQLGGIIGGVGQAMAITWPITGDYNTAIETPSEGELNRYLQREELLRSSGGNDVVLTPRQRERFERGQRLFEEQLASLGERGTQALANAREGTFAADPYTRDDKLWAVAVALATSALLFFGRYGLIQTLSTVFVVAFTFITIGNVFSLQQTEIYSISTADFLRGMSFRLPEPLGDQRPLLVALATFGIIGVGATELIAYPYWCLEKGYAKFTGPRSQDSAWAERARGWMRVMTWDAFASMIVYTVATLAFFIMGVAVLHNEGRDPNGMRMVSTLATAYVPVFGEYARWLFLVGAVAVLYSTFMVANAGNARMFTDALKVLGLVDRQSERTHQWWVGLFSIALPLICLLVFVTGADPVQLVIAAGTMQATLLPMLGFAALYFRYRMTDSRLRPSRLWDVMLILSCLGMLVAGVWGVWQQVAKLTGG